MMGSFVAWTSPVLPQLEENSPNHSSSFSITTEQGSWIGSLLAIGGMGSSLLAGYLARRFGCKKCTIAFAIPCLIFTALVIYAQEAYMLMLARFFSGIASGGSCVIGPMYMSEISSVNLRGTLGSFFEFAIYLGVAATAICGAYVDYVVLSIIIGGMSVACIISFFFLPESPTYLMRMNDRKGAEKALAFFRDEGYNVSKELDLIQEEIDAIARSNVKFVDLLKSRGSKRGLISSVGLSAFQQLSGITAVIFYTVPIFQESGANLDPYTSSVILAFIQLGAAATAVFIMELANRRTFLYLSALGMCLSHLGLSAYFHLKSSGVAFTGIDYVPLTLVIFFITSFAFGMGPVPWMMNGEIFSIEVKGPAGGITITTTWTMAFVSTKTFPTMMASIGPGWTFLILGMVTGSFLAFVKCFIPETRGKTLQEIQLELNA